MASLQELAHCGSGWAETRAKTALDIQQQRNSGALSPAEAAELMQDLIATDRLNEEADDMAVKTALITAITLASKLA
jgi:hypothetical protein